MLTRKFNKYLNYVDNYLKHTVWYTQTLFFIWL